MSIRNFFRIKRASNNVTDNSADERALEILAKPWGELINEDFPPVQPITEETRELTKRESILFRGSVRMALGDFWTDEEFEKFREGGTDIKYYGLDKNG